MVVFCLLGVALFAQTGDMLSLKDAIALYEDDVAKTDDGDRVIEIIKDLVSQSINTPAPNSEEDDAYYNYDENFGYYADDNHNEYYGYTGDGGYTPLMYAFEYGYTELVKSLIAEGADIDAQSKNGSTALIIVARKGETEAVKTLIELGADVNVVTGRHGYNPGGYGEYSGGYSPLLYASMHGNIELVKLLIEAGSDIEKGSEEGSTALIEAVKNEDTEVTKVLIEAGANLNVKTRNDATVLMKAAKEEQIEIFKLLIEAGADLEARGIRGITALMIASEIGNLELVTLLLDAGAKVNASDDDGDTALSVATRKGHADIVTLLEKGRTISQEQGKTYRTTDNLRLRAIEGVIGKALFTVPKDTPVQILSIGSIDKIDGIIAYWVEVEVVEDTIDTAGKIVTKGTIGWCFGGYLTNENIGYKASSKTLAEVVPKKLIEAPTIAVVEVPTDTENEGLVTDVPEKSAINTLVIPLITWGVGGLVLAYAIVVVVLVRKKK